VTDVRLYGRMRIVEFVEKALKRDGVPEKPLPIVLLVGPRGSGGSMLLGRLWDEFAADCLGVRLDLKAAQGVEDIVLAAVQGLARKVRGIRGIGFPRIAMLLKALSFVDDGGGRTAFEAYLRAGPREAAAKTALNDWARRAAPLVSPEQQVLLGAVAKLLGALRSAVGRSRDARVLGWLADYGTRSGGGGYDSLWELYRLHHGRTGDTDTPRPVAKTLCAAFLADLRSDFNESPLLHGQRPKNCLLLLDNAGGRAGDLFLELLAECRRESGAGGERPDPAVVVAVQRGRVRRRVIEPVEPTDERLDFDVRHPAAPGDGGHPVWWYPVRLADLDNEYVVEMCASGVLGSQNRDADFLYALTGGHPESVGALARLLARLGRAAPYDPRLLLGEQELPDDWTPVGGGDAAVEEHLLRRTLADDLVIGPDGGILADGNPMLDVMAVLSVTPGLRRGACNAALQYLGWEQFDADTAQRRLTAAMWLDETPDGAAARLHPLIALLLRRWLARQPEAWRRAHMGYAAHYSRREDAPVRHHHTLALVEPSQRQPLATVVGYLEEEYARCGSPQDWLRVLDQVTAAPNRLRTTLDPRSFVTALAGVADARSRHQAITRLTVARWLYNDRYFDPARQLAQTIANEYGHLADGTDDNEVLFRQAGKYRRVENNWKD
jgi:hypothetical protein